MLSAVSLLQSHDTASPLCVKYAVDGDVADTQPAYQNEWRLEEYQREGEIDLKARSKSMNLSVMDKASIRVL
jgi:hypothetical protein